MSPTLQVSTGAAYSRILGVGGYRPARLVTNDEICEVLDSNDEWIRDRTGIITRRFAGEGDGVVDMAVAAAGKAMAMAGVVPDQIGAVLLASVTFDRQMPSAAAEVASRLGAPRAAATDLQAACAGFGYGVGIADALVRTGNVGHVLVIGVERLSDFTDPTDRSTAFIFADGAGAVVIGPSDTPAIGPTIWGADADNLDAIIMTRTWGEFAADPTGRRPSIVMAGQRVFRWAVGEMAKVGVQAVEAAGITLADLDAFIPHQANNRITDALARALKLPEGLPIARDIIEMGNTSAASIPLAMEAMLESGEVQSGGLALTLGFGAGLVYAGQVVVLP